MSLKLRGCFPGGASSEEHHCQCKRLKRREFNPSVGENPLEEGVATHSSILAWRIPWIKGLAGCGPCGHTESDMTEVTLCTHKSQRRGWTGEHHHPTSEGFKDLSPWGGQEEKRTEN